MITVFTYDDTVTADEVRADIGFDLFHLVKVNSFREMVVATHNKQTECIWYMTPIERQDLPSIYIPNANICKAVVSSRCNRRKVDALFHQRPIDLPISQLPLFFTGHGMDADIVYSLLKYDPKVVIFSKENANDTDINGTIDMFNVQKVFV